MDQQAHLYRRLFARFATGVAVVLGENHGMTVNSLTSVSLDPLLLLFCARNESRSAESFLATGRFSVNILRRGQESLSRQFSRVADVEGPLCRRGEGFVWIEDANAVFLCDVEQVYPGGDHRIILGRVARMFGPESVDEPLIYYDGNYAALGAAARPLFR